MVFLEEFSASVSMDLSSSSFGRVLKKLGDHSLDFTKSQIECHHDDFGFGKLNVDESSNTLAQASRHFASFFRDGVYSHKEGAIWIKVMERCMWL